ncbi:hypothetical protein [Streptomyces hesseae]|uniref:Uncharacterized protein n=1 Tax=Streptomyces hesseae TaxID=3075519 RepID=A0ABU2SWI8_9ACTN|nr:hypothetical protein [Streptomyces sp. DSM 40473]MDT0452734.1 hypothetical protein [Streptomyces sp. DSM 40473]
MVNIALEELVEAGVEPSAFSSLDDLTSRIRGEANAGICVGIFGSLGEDHCKWLLGMVTESGVNGRKLVQSAQAGCEGSDLIALQA